MCVNLETKLKLVCPMTAKKGNPKRKKKRSKMEDEKRRERQRDRETAPQARADLN